MAMKLVVGGEELAGIEARLRPVAGNLAELRGVSDAFHAAARAVSARGVKPKSGN